MTERQARLFNQIPVGDDWIPGHEVFWTLSDFRSMHCMERAGVIEVLYEPTDEFYIRRAAPTSEQPEGGDDA